MKPALNEIAQLLENLAVRFDALEGVLVRQGILADDELGLYDQVHTPAVRTHVARFRALVAALPD